MSTIEKKITNLPSLSPDALQEIIKGMYAGKPLLGSEGLLTQLAKDLIQNVICSIFILEIVRSKVPPSIQSQMET